MSGREGRVGVSEVGEWLSMYRPMPLALMALTGVGGSRCGEGSGVAELCPGGAGTRRSRPITAQPATRAQPACGGVSPEVFFGPADSLVGRPRYGWERRALAVCAGCPVVAACLAEALKYPAAEQHGVVGGRTAGQRQAFLRASRPGRGLGQQSRRRRSAGFPPRAGQGGLPRSGRAAG
jgi:hypothetical protein